MVHKRLTEPCYRFAAGAVPADGRGGLRGGRGGATGGAAGRGNGQGGGMEQAQQRPLQAVRLDLEGERLWCGAEAVHLRPKSFAGLRYLVAQPGRVVRKEELLQALWPDTTVSDQGLKVCMSELRKAL